MATAAASRRNAAAGTMMVSLVAVGASVAIEGVVATLAVAARSSRGGCDASGGLIGDALTPAAASWRGRWLYLHDARSDEISAIETDKRMSTLVSNATFNRAQKAVALGIVGWDLNADQSI
jgi:hypothetical protein